MALKCLLSIRPNFGPYGPCPRYTSIRNMNFCVAPRLHLILLVVCVPDPLTNLECVINERAVLVSSITVFARPATTLGRQHIPAHS